jgi:2-(1,2-epoxy-1,2-dihydrophenyl)acetyl-CoA isomerase
MVLLSEVTDRIGTITLNRPERRNALDGPLVAALDAAVKEMAADPAVRVVILTGAAAEGAVGGFCAGGDVKSTEREGMALGVPSDALEGDLARHDDHAAMLLHLMPKPTIAMVGGPAVGAGCSLAGACDLRFASTDAAFSAGFLPNGLTGDYGGTFWWTRIAGTAVARRLYLMNEKLSAIEALRIGMVHEVLEPEQLRGRVMEVASQLARTPAELLGRLKSNLNEAEDSPARRRFLFANEATNQIDGAKAMMERMRARKRSDGAS